MTDSSLVCLKVEIATAGTVFDVLTGGSVTWFDISSSVLFSAGISTSRGRRSESDTTSAGSMSFTAKTLPTNFGPSRVNFKVRQPIRLSWYDPVTYDELAAAYATYGDYAAAVATYEAAGGSGTWRTLWTGSVSEIRQGWENGVRGVQEIVCTDNVAVAERTTLEGWATQYALSFGAVSLLLPLDDSGLDSPPREASGAAFVPQLFARSVGVPPDGASVALGQGVGPSGEGTVARFAGASSAGGFCLDANDTLGRLPSGESFSVFVRLEEAASRAMVVYSANTDHYSRGFRVDLGINADGKAYLFWVHPTGTEQITGTTVLSPNDWHHLAFTVDEVSTAFYSVKLYVDGVAEGGTYSDFDGPFAIGAYQMRLGASLDGTKALNGDLAHLAQFTQILTPTEVADLAGVATGWVGESTLARFNRVQRLAGFSTATTTGGQGTMGLQTIAGKSVAAVCNEIAAVEHAPWYCTTDGTLTLASRADRYNRNAADVTLPATAINPGTSITVSDRDIANRITVSRPGGFTTTLTDTASVDEFGIYPRSVTFAAGSDAEAETYAAALLKGAAQPTPETDSLTVDVSTVYRTVSTSLTGGADIGTQIAVTGLPLDAFAGINRFWVEGVSDRFGVTGWQRTYNTSAAAVDTSAWVLGTTAGDELGTDTRLGL